MTKNERIAQLEANVKMLEDRIQILEARGAYTPLIGPGTLPTIPYQPNITPPWTTTWWANIPYNIAGSP